MTEIRIRVRVSFYQPAVMPYAQESVCGTHADDNSGRGARKHDRRNWCEGVLGDEGEGRELLGELITDWIRSHPEHEIVDKIVTQSSDSEFHCLTITLFYKHNAKA